MVVRWTRWTLTRRKWAWGVSSQLLTSHHLTQTHSGQRGKHSFHKMWYLSISPSTQIAATFSGKLLLKPRQTLNKCQENTETLWNTYIHVSGIFLVCWISFSASSHSLTRQSKNPEQSQCFQFPPEKWFCFMRDVTSTPVWLTDNFKYSALHCTVLHTVLFLQITQNLACSSS